MKAARDGRARHGWLATVSLILVLPCAATASFAAASAPSSPDATLSEIAAALSSGQPAKAQQLATAALAGPGLDAGTRSRLLLDRGLAEARQGARAGALADFTQAIDTHALTPADQTKALFERGMVRDSSGLLPQALADYDAAVKLSPHSAAALNNRANAYRRLGRLEEAKRDYRASLAAGNSQPEYPYYGLGEIAEAQGDPAAARGFYVEALAANPAYGLAAERLKALGGPAGGTAPAAAMPGASAIVLHPPGQEQHAGAGGKPLPAVPAVPPRPEHPEALRGAVAVAEKGGALALRPAIITGKGHDEQVQLGSWRQEGEATQAWLRAVKQAGGDLIGLTPHVVAADLPGRGRYYRLRVSPAGGAAELCAALTAKGLDCLPVRD
jgi:tetratricopeptide (TPR) repeat protein